jgi:hypothetical protein
MRALSVLSLKKNGLGTKEAGKVLGEMLKVNSVLKELDLSDNRPDSGGDPVGFAQELAAGIKDNGAMTKLDISKCELMAEGGKALAAGLKGNQLMMELNVAGNRLGQNVSGGRYVSDMSGVIALADVMPDMGALLVLSLNSNSLGPGGGKALAEGLRGNSVIEELNLADNKLTDYGNDMSGVVAIADVIPGMGALSVLSLKDNRLATKEGGKALAQALANSSTLKELDVSSNDWEDVFGNRLGDGPGFAQELAVGIKDNGALIKLDIRSNHLEAEQKEDLQRICVASGIALAM